MSGRGWAERELNRVGAEVRTWPAWMRAAARHKPANPPSPVPSVSPPGNAVVLYRTIVVDPPWDHSDGTGWNPGERDFRGQSGTGLAHVTRPPYDCMSVKAICALPVSTMAESDAHLYLWTTQRFLHESFHVVESWGFRVSATLTWCKAPMGFMGGAFRSSTEFCHFARRGSLAHKTQAPTRWFTWSRVGWTQSDPAAKHSRKPDAFIDLVESVSPGPYLEMFARRQRLGWDTWGDEALAHVEIGAARV